MTYTFRGLTIPDHMMEPIRRYIEEHRIPGHFLQAVISNDLKEAVGRADDDNLPLLGAYIGYFYNEAPGGCWGSKEALKRWSTLPQRRALWKLFEQRVKDEDLPEDFLDDMVHDLASQEGSNVNNDGMEGQFDYLFDQCGPEWVAQRLRLGIPDEDRAD